MDLNQDGVDEFSIWNIKHVLSHVSENMVSFILLICVFFIIYLADRLSNYNIMLMSIPAVAMPTQIFRKRKDKRLS
jgi:hypothetical protein